MYSGRKDFGLPARFAGSAARTSRASGGPHAAASFFPSSPAPGHGVRALQAFVAAGYTRSQRASVKLRVALYCAQSTTQEPRP
jgi:hypothetical protein